MALPRKRSSGPERRYHHGDLRRALVDAALALISEGELGTFSLREGARRAGGTPAAPYHHFQDKTALLAPVGQGGLPGHPGAAADAAARPGATDCLRGVAAPRAAYLA